MLRRNEPDRLYQALVAELAYSIVPTSIMGLTLTGVGFYAYGVTGYLAILLATVAGFLASVAKVTLILFHRRRQNEAALTLRDAGRIEIAHSLGTCGMAGSIGALAASMFATTDLRIHLIATALLFGYCAGVVTRVSVRPVVAATAITLAATPTLVSAALNGDSAHLVVATIFLVFLLGAMETVAHVYRTARAHIERRFEMANLARLDPLTHLANRLGLHEAFESLPREPGEVVALHAFDLDGFKQINDTFGHATGDRLLCELADRLRSIGSDSVFVSRIGGDEFVILQRDVRSELVVAGLAHKVHALLTQPYRLGSARTCSIGVSLGYTTAAARTAKLEELLRTADEAAYAAKREGGGVRYRFSETYPAALSG